jgi:preprotein translocase subunit SecB
MSDAQQPIFQIQRMYLKDLSLEIPGAPRIFLEQGTPALEVAIDTTQDVLADGIHEITVTTTVTTRLGDKVLFLVEAREAGIFEIRNVPPEQMPLVLNVVCPNIIYPYLRSNVADVVQRAGFPPIHLTELNFESVYQSRLAAQQAGQETGPVILTQNAPRPN